MRIMATDAAELTATLLKATTRIHLLNVTDRLVRSPLRSIVGMHQDRQNFLQPLSRTKVKHTPSIPGDAPRQKMTLETHTIPFPGIQFCRIDDL